ncbi:MAG TPA: hypothetical protein H9823_08465 [Candidatus Rubneribacter avistercoris]|nr:hypothetical protein [Candidatus Rubneribacter avistercoris]
MKLFGKGGGPLTPAQKKLATAVAAMALIVATSVSVDLALSRLDAERAEEATAEEVQPGPALDEKSSDPSETEGASGAEAAGEETSGAKAGADEESLGTGAVYEGDGVSVENRAGRDLDATGREIADAVKSACEANGFDVSGRAFWVTSVAEDGAYYIVSGVEGASYLRLMPQAAGGFSVMLFGDEDSFRRQLEADSSTKNEGANGGTEVQESFAQSDPADAAKGGAAS